MRGLVRVLIMFGPLIFRQFKKMQRANQNQSQHPPNSEEHTEKNPNTTRNPKWKSRKKSKSEDNIEDATTEKTGRSYNPDDIVGHAGEKKGWSIKDIFFRND